MLFLKQSTAATVKIGPFLDSTDGITAETGLTLSRADILLSKADGAFTQKTEVTTCTHDAGGWYGCPLDETDTATVGRLQLSVQESGACPVWHEYFVLPANVYNSLLGTDLLDVNQAQVIGTAPSEGAAGRLAAAFTKFGDVATPVFTAACVNQAADSNVILGAIGATGTGLTALGDTRIANLNATVGSRSSHAAADVAALVLTTPANKLATDVSGQVTTGALANGAITAAAIATGAIDADALAADAATEIVTAIFAKTGLTAGGVVTFGNIVKALYGAARGKITKSGDAYTFYDDDGTTSLFTLTIAAASRTPS